MNATLVAWIWLTVGALTGVAESFLIAREHGYYFNTLRSLLTFLFLPAAAYAVAGILVGALLCMIARPLTRSTRRALVWSASLCPPFFIILFWGSALDGRFFGTVGNALGHLGMVTAALVSFTLVRRAVSRGRRRWLQPLAVAGTVFVVLAAIAAVTLPLGRPLTRGDPTDSGTPVRPPNILLVTIDTLRADRTGYSGYRPRRQPGGDGLGTTPRLDGLAAAGTVFTDAIVPEVVTDPSHASLLTAVPPWEHGVWRNAMPLQLDVPLVAEAFADAGYTTAAFVSVEHLDGHISHLSRGFTSYGDCGCEDRYRRHVAGQLLARHVGSLFAHERDARAVCATAAAWLESQAASQTPFFLWVHVFDPHMPYVDHETGFVFGMEEREGHAEAPDVSPAIAAQAAYDSEVRFADSGLGLLLDALEHGGLVAETVVCVTSDHGEHMDEAHVAPENWFAHVDVYDEVCRVPLVFAGPGVDEGRTVRRQVSSMDVAPALLGLAGIRGGLGGRDAYLADLVAPAESRGRGAPVVETGHGSVGRAVEPVVTLANPHRELDHRSVRDGRWKLIERGGLPSALHDLAEDPGETLNVIHDHPEQVSILAAILAETPTPQGFFVEVGTSRELDPATREMLEALGYIR